MSDPDYSKLAKQFMDAWQEQISGQMNDRDMVRQMLDMMQGMAPGAGSVGNPFMGGFSGKGRTYETTQKRSTSSAATGRAVPPGAGDVSVDELARRLERCEDRIIELEGLVSQLRTELHGSPSPTKKSSGKHGVVGKGNERSATAARHRTRKQSTPRSTPQGD